MIYFDNAATSFPKGKDVAGAIRKAFFRCGNPGRSGHAPAMYAAETMYACREALAERFGTVPENTVLLPSATLALNYAIKGFARRKAVMSSLEHNAVCRPLYAMRDSAGMKLSVFGTFADGAFDDDSITESFGRACEGADLAVFTHASNVCGRILPAKRLTDEAHRHGALAVIDAAQTAGYIDFTFADTGADMIAVAGHKGLGGPCGTGALLFAPDFSADGKTVIEGGTGIFSFDAGMPQMLPERYEAGTPAAYAFAGLTAELKHRKTDGWQAVFGRLLDGLQSIRGVRLHGAPEKGGEAKYVPVILFTLEGRDCDTVMYELSKRGICVRSGFHCAPLAHISLGTREGGVRVSAGHGNTPQEADRLIEAVREIAGE